MFQNDEVLHGQILNRAFRIQTPYGFIPVPLRNCAGISFEDAGNNREILLTKNFNRLTGILTDQVIQFKNPSTNVQKEIRKEKIRFILFKTHLDKKNRNELHEKTDLFIMTNGDLLTGKPENSALIIRTSNGEVTVNFDEVQSIDIFESSPSTAVVRKKNENLIRGDIQTELVPVKLDVNASIVTIYRNKFSKIYFGERNLQVFNEFMNTSPRVDKSLALMEDKADIEHISNTIGMKFQLIHPGAFMMGSDRGRFDEKPLHKVTITQPFYMAIYEVTQEQWERVMGYNPSAFKGGDHPVENVSWNEAQEFCRKLSAAEGTRYRLPTEAEWEFACRAGTFTKYYWGNEFNGDYAWTWFNSEGETHPVGIKKPNPWGLFDMIGNVEEWCEDAYHRYPPGERVDPKHQSGANRMHRGGGWDSPLEICRSASRLHLDPAERNDSLGFRIVRAK